MATTTKKRFCSGSRKKHATTIKLGKHENVFPGLCRFELFVKQIGRIIAQFDIATIHSEAIVVRLCRISIVVAFTFCLIGGMFYHPQSEWFALAFQLRSLIFKP